MADQDYSSSHDDEKQGFFRRNLGLILLAISIAISLTQVIVASYRLTPPDKSVIRIAFWQLEEGYRDAMKLAIDRYQKLHPDVKIEMMAVTERVYAQWINVHLIAGTAPDIVEMGNSNLVSSDEYKVKYFIPLTEYLEEPNPYNTNTDLARIPWRETFADGVRGGFSDNLQDYYNVPTTFWGMGIYVNMDMYTAATGKRELPRTLQEFLDACEQVNTLPQRSTDPKYKNRKIMPIVSCNKLGGFENNLNTAFTASLEPKLDTNLDGSINTDEVYAGYLHGDLDFYKTPQLRGLMESYRELVTKYFPRDFASMDRQTAMFKFVQGYGCFIITGSWDGKSLMAQVGNRFRIMPLKYPVPAKGERWGDLCVGRSTSAAAPAGGGYGIYRFSQHREKAIDFLRYLTSVKMNEDFNTIAEWPPAVVGTTVNEMMKPFMPDPEGFTGNINFKFEEALDRVYSGLSQAYMMGTISYDEFVQQFEEALNDADNGGDRAWSLKYKKEYDSVRNDDRAMAIQTIAMLMQPEEKDAQQKYDRILLQQVRKNDAQSNLWNFKELRGKPMPQY